MEYIDIEIYKGIPICKDLDEEKLHVAHCFTGYKTVEEVRARIDEILQKREERAKLLDDKTHQTFDMNRGECLEIDGELYTIQVLPDGGDKHPELTGQEFIYVHNNRGSKYEQHGLIRKLFTGRPQDAVEAIRAGEGDLIQGSTFFGHRSEHVIRFLNREIGEKVRAEVIKGFEDAEFGICLRINFTEGWGSEYDIGEDDKLVNGKFQEKVRPKLFTSEDEAHSYAEKLSAEIVEIAKSLVDDQAAADYLENTDADSVRHQAVLSEYRNLLEDPGTITPSFHFDICQVLIR